MDLSFSITLSHDALFGNSGIVSVWNETTSVYEEIEGVIRWVQAVETQMQTSAELEETTVKNMPLFDIYSLNVSGLLLKDAAVTKSFLSDVTLEDKKEYKIKLSIDTDIFFERYYYVSKINIVGVKGQFIEVVIDFSEAKIWQA